MIRALACAAALAVMPTLAFAQSPGFDPAGEAELEARIEHAVELNLDDEDLTAITDAATTFALNLIEAIDVETLTLQAVTGGLNVAGGMATNGAWARPDPDQIVTYGLMADYALHQAAADAEDE